MRNNLILFLFLIASLPACDKENMGDCFKSTGKIEIETRALAPFTALELDDRINLFVTFDNEYSVQVKAGKTLLEMVKTEVIGNTLRIENNNTCNWMRSFKNDIDVFLTVPDLTDFTYYGGGEVRFMNPLVTDTFRLELWHASGNLYLTIIGDYVTLKSNTGPGDVFCSGTARELVGYNNGAGTVDAGQIVARNVLAVNTGIGKLVVNAQENLKADIKNSGNIEYFGSPSVVLNKIGSGELVSRN